MKDASIIAPHFQDAEKAREFMEAKRWPDGPECPHCGVVNEAYRIEGKEGSKTRKGVWKCAACREQFTVTVGTIMEDSHITLNKWLYAFHLLCSSKKGISAHQMHRMLGVTYKSAWFMMHRVRYEKPAQHDGGNHQDGARSYRPTSVRSAQPYRQQGRSGSPGTAWRQGSLYACESRHR
jgi:transposase-like protein